MVKKRQFSSIFETRQPCQSFGLMAEPGLCPTKDLHFLYEVWEDMQTLPYVGHLFMKALARGDYEGAYHLCSPSLQAEFSNPQGLQSFIEGQALCLTAWQWDYAGLVGLGGQLLGQGTLAQGESINLNAHLTKLDGTWRIESLFFWEAIL